MDIKEWDEVRIIKPGDWYNHIGICKEVINNTAAIIFCINHPTLCFVVFDENRNDVEIINRKEN